MGEPTDFVVASDESAWTQKGVALIATAAKGAVNERGRFLIALSGGSTPRPLYEALAGRPDAVDWARTQVFFSDERFVPPDSPRSNFWMAKETLLSKVPIPERHVHPVDTVDIEPERAASLYAQGIRRVAETAMGEIPVFDLILLGLGDDGHTASLFPGTEGLGVRDEIVAANYVPQQSEWRITFTYPLINAGESVMFAVRGAAKAPIVAGVLNGDAAYPASGVHPASGKLIWLLDEAAASQVRGRE